MSLLSFLLGEKKKTANVAKERLQIILAHERGGRGGRDRDGKEGRGDAQPREQRSEPRAEHQRRRGDLVR